MAESSSPRIACPHCGKQYKWKPQLAGRKTQCTGCGQKMRLPQEPGGKVEPIGGLLKDKPDESAGGYEVAVPGEDDAAAGRVAAGSAPDHCPACNAKLKPGAVICINCGYHVGKGQKLQTSVGAAPPQPVARNVPTPTESSSFTAAAALGGRGTDAAIAEEPRREVPQNVRDIWVPVGLVVLGFAVAILQQMMFSPTPLGIMSAVIAVTVQLVVYVPLLLVALFLAVKLLDVSFGSLWTGLLKLMAVVLGPSAVGAIVAVASAPLIGSLMGSLTGSVVSVAFYWGLLMFLFGLDLGETFMLVVIIFVMKLAGAFLLGVVLLMIMSSVTP